MTDMDEIRELLSEYADAVFDRGAASGASNEVYPPNAGETSSRSALLQRVEALREERDAALAAQNRAPSPPETPAPSPVESPGEERPRADLAEIERMVSEYGRAIVYGGNGLKALEARATLLSAIRSLRAPREVEEVREALRRERELGRADGVDEAAAILAGAWDEGEQGDPPEVIQGYAEIALLRGRAEDRRRRALLGDAESPAAGEAPDRGDGEGRP